MIQNRGGGQEYTVSIYSYSERTAGIKGDNFILLAKQALRVRMESEKYGLMFDIERRNVMSNSMLSGFKS